MAATFREKIRHLIRDNETPYVWSDAELDVFIEIEGAEQYRCAANVLRAWAREKALEAYSYTMTDGKQMDKRSVVDALLAVAESYEDMT
ncbi:MAG: hypothetical protein PVH29_14795 [Candidatus Zixiibacteriota bacterium]|jgi:hypothetical protein